MARLKTRPHPDDNAEIFELDMQMVGGYHVFEWRDIARYLLQQGYRDLAEYVFSRIHGRNEAERMQLARSEEDRDIIANAAAVVIGM